jgi:hypothetical protein
MLSTVDTGVQIEVDRRQKAFSVVAQGPVTGGRELNAYEDLVQLWLTAH